LTIYCYLIIFKPMTCQKITYCNIHDLHLRHIHHTVCVCESYTTQTMRRDTIWKFSSSTVELLACRCSLKGIYVFRSCVLHHHSRKKVNLFTLEWFTWSSEILFAFLFSLNRRSFIRLIIMCVASSCWKRITFQVKTKAQ
jgi:hypothetical protein